MVDTACRGCGADLGRPGGVTGEETVTRVYPARLADAGAIECDMAAAGMPEDCSVPPAFRCSLCGRELEADTMSLRGRHV